MDDGRDLGAGGGQLRIEAVVLETVDQAVLPVGLDGVLGPVVRVVQIGELGHDHLRRQPIAVAGGVVIDKAIHEDRQLLTGELTGGVEVAVTGALGEAGVLHPLDGGGAPTAGLHVVVGADVVVAQVRAVQTGEDGGQLFTGQHVVRGKDAIAAADEVAVRRDEVHVLIEPGFRRNVGKVLGAQGLSGKDQKRRHDSNHEEHCEQFLLHVLFPPVKISFPDSYRPETDPGLDQLDARPTWSG